MVDIPKDVTDPNIRIPYHYPDKIEMRSYNPAQKGHLGQIKKAVEAIREAMHEAMQGILQARFRYGLADPVIVMSATVCFIHG